MDCGRISIGDHTRIDPFCVLSARGGIEIGRHVHLAAHCTLAGNASIRIADFAGISHGVRLLSSSDDFSGAWLTGPTVPKDRTSPVHAAIHIGRHAILGAGTVVLPGVEVHEGAAVGALSLVRETLGPWIIHAGIPARPIRERKRELLGLVGDLNPSG